MTYFQQLRDFRKTYKVSAKDNLKLFFLYPVFKFHFWLQGTKLKRLIANAVFKILPGNEFFTIYLHFSALKGPIALLVLLISDILSIFGNFFWPHVYLLKRE